MDISSITESHTVAQYDALPRTASVLMVETDRLPLYCQHKARLVGLVCTECQQEIVEDHYVTALENKRWHTSCFKCARCKTVLNDYYERVLFILSQRDVFSLIQIISLGI